MGGSTATRFGYSGVSRSVDELDGELHLSTPLPRDQWAMDLPLLILAGADPPFTVQGEHHAQNVHPVDRKNRALLQIDGRSLMEWSLLVFSQKFDDIFIAGQKELFHTFKGRMNVRAILDHGPIRVGTRLRECLKLLSANGNDRVLVTTCDILPRPDDVEIVLDRYHALRAKNDVVLFLPYNRTQQERPFGKHAYPFVQRDGQVCRGLVSHFWLIDSSRLRLPFIEWCLNACYLRRCPVGSTDASAMNSANRRAFLRQTRGQFACFLWKAWKEQILDENLAFTLRFVLTMLHAVQYVRGGLRSIERQESVLQKVLIRSDAIEQTARQVVIDLLDIDSLAFDVDDKDDLLELGTDIHHDLMRQ